MGDNAKTKVSFFFGAGAEGKGNFDLPSGLEYMKKSILVNREDEEIKKILLALEKFWKEKYYYNGTYKYTKYTADAKNFMLTNMIIQKCEKDDVFKNRHKGTIKLLLSDSYNKRIYNTGNSNNENKNETKSAETKNKQEGLKKEFSDIITGKIVKYSEIKSDIYKDLFLRYGGDYIEIDYNLGTAGMLDERFHTIINPQKYGEIKFSKIFNYYWFCYFAVLIGIIKYYSNKSIEFFDTYLNNGKLEYEKVLSNINELTRELYNKDLKIPIDGTYYHYIKEELKNNAKIECQGIATANYYRFCSEISENVAYLNGELRLFEFPEALEVTDASADTENSNEQLFFPFIFGQSLVKPIINQYQIKAFSKFQEILDVSNIMVMLGFNLNEDDNHINAFLHDFVKSGRTLIFVTNKEASEVKANDKLKCEEDSNIVVCKVKYGKNNEVVKEIFKKIDNIINEKEKSK